MGADSFEHAASTVNATSASACNLNGVCERAGMSGFL